MMKHRILFSIIALFSLFFVSSVSAVRAQSLKLELANPQAPINVGDTVQVNLKINTGGVDSINADALIQFEPSAVSIQSAQTGNFFTYFSSSPLAGNPKQYLISSWEESVAHSKSSSTDTLLATMSIKAIAAGSTSLSFVCAAGSEADSNINRASDSQDILTNCAGLTPLTLTIGGSASVGTPTPSGAITSTPAIATPTIEVTPTVIPTITNTPTPSATRTITPTRAPIPTVTTLPRAGVVQTTMMVGGAAALFLTIGGLLFIL